MNTANIYAKASELWPIEARSASLSLENYEFDFCNGELSVRRADIPNDEWKRIAKFSPEDARLAMICNTVDRVAFTFRLTSTDSVREVVFQL